MNTYAELYGNIKKEPIKNGSGNKLIAANALADVTTFGSVENIVKEGDAMSNVFGSFKSPLAQLDDNNRLNNAFNNNVFGIILCPF